MATGKVPPLRQQMINMMYLVLVALMAMNVSAEVLRAFNIVNNSLNETQVSLQDKNKVLYAQFEAELENDPAKTKPLWDDAQKVKQWSDELVAHLDELEKELVELGGGRDPDRENRIVSESDIDIATRILVDGPKGKELRNKIEETRQNMLSVLQKRDINKEIPLKAENPEGAIEGPKTWEGRLFNSVPLAAATTIIAKLKNDTRNSEGEIVQALMGDIFKKIQRFDKVKAIVTTSSPFVVPGQEFTATVSMGAYSSTQEMTVVLDGQELTAENGQVQVSKKFSEQGFKTLKGVIKYKDPEGNVKEEEFKTEVQVFQGSANIAATKMNVFYIGLENPVSVTVAGFPPDKVSVSMAGKGSLRQVSSGNYIAKVSGGRDRADRIVTVTASVKMEGGQNKTMGQQQFRVLPVPPPTAYFGNKANGNISKGALMATPALIARMGDFAFEGLNYRVTKYTCIVQPRGGNMLRANGNSPSIDGQVKGILQQAGSGSQVIFTNIEVEAPGVGKKNLENGIVLNVE